jgi:hypothetical protein
MEDTYFVNHFARTLKMVQDGVDEAIAEKEAPKCRQCGVELIEEGLCGDCAGENLDNLEK